MRANVLITCLKYLFFDLIYNYKIFIFFKNIPLKANSFVCQWVHVVDQIAKRTISHCSVINILQISTVSQPQNLLTQMTNLLQVPITFKYNEHIRILCEQSKIFRRAKKRLACDNYIESFMVCPSCEER